MNAGAAADEPSELIHVEAPFAMPPIPLPRFPERDFVITRYGAKMDEDATDSIARAITACHEAGGGRVIIPEGRWRTGKIHLKSRVNLHLQPGARLVFKDDPAAYLPAVQSSWEGFECFNYCSMRLSAEGIYDLR